MAEASNFQSLLHKLKDAEWDDRIAIKELLGVLGARTFGPVLLLLGVIAISPLTIVPGGTWIVAFAVLVVAGQISIGRHYPWLPRRVLEYSFPRAAFENTLSDMERPARFVDRFLKPRLVFLTQPPLISLLSLGCVGAALVTFPLGLVPLGPVLPSLTIVMFGLGMTARDGAVLLISVAGLVASFWLVLRLAGVWT